MEVLVSLVPNWYSSVLKVDMEIETLRVLRRVVGLRKVRVAVLFAGRYVSMKVRSSLKFWESWRMGSDQLASPGISLGVETEMEKSPADRAGKVITWSKDINRLLSEAADREGTGGCAWQTEETAE